MEMTLANASGLSVEFLETGAVKSIHAGPIRISLKAATPFSRSGTNLYLRKRTAPFRFTALLGPESGSLFGLTDEGFVCRGNWEQLDYTCTLALSRVSYSWQWCVEIRNRSAEPVELDLIWVQDAGLKPMNAGLINEYYVSQYLERRILKHDLFGAVACCRQNMRESTGHPWCMMACRNTAVAGSVDGMQFYGKTCRETGVPEGLLAEQLGGEYAGESSVFALQEKPFGLAAGALHRSVFLATYLPDHPEPTSERDLQRLSGVMREFGDDAPPHRTIELTRPSRSIFTTTPLLPVEDLNEDELTGFFGTDRRHADYDRGRLLSFFCRQISHVVLRAKEVLVDRPHAQILQARAGLVPDESVMSTTCFAGGVFNSHLTQGNTNFNTLLSVCTSQFNPAHEAGQRMFVVLDGRRFLLGVPSAFEMGVNYCRWLYKHGSHVLQIRCWTSKTSPRITVDFKVIQGGDVRLLVTHDLDPLNGWLIQPARPSGACREFIARPKAGSMISGKFPDAQFRLVINSADVEYRLGDAQTVYPDDPSHQANPLLVFDVAETSHFCMSVVGEVCAPAEVGRIDDPDRQWLADCEEALASWQDMSLGLSLQGNQEDVSAIREILPWYGMNAMTHFLTPYGLEQFSGAAWGTRDVSQGPMELLVSLQQQEAARSVLCRVFSNQHSDGGWPQWWMFDSYSNIRAADAHGDVPYWCLIALGHYIRATGDLRILDEVLPYYHEQGPAHAERMPLSEHVARLVEMVVSSFLPGTALVPFGGGDWNDSLQPVSQELARRMVSSWTVQMNYQAFSHCQWIYEQAGDAARAAQLQKICEQIKVDFNKYLLQDGVVAGYGLLEEEGRVRLLLHPSDAMTGIHYSILPMNRGVISGIFDKPQADRHQDLIEQHLVGPDGARLMDRPLKYKGGIQTIFQRAESSTFFGREIGLMYVHEHLRFAESLARTGRAAALLKALRQAIPVSYRDVVACGDIRQSNCYYSSSDVVFRNRYEADERYDEIKTGTITLRGGWRVYSSGPGIYIGLIVSRLLGWRIEAGSVIIDPVMPPSLDGLCISMKFAEHPLTCRYLIKEGCFSPKAITINGSHLPFAYEENPYREGGAVIPAAQFLARLDRPENLVEVRL